MRCAFPLAAYCLPLTNSSKFKVQSSKSSNSPPAGCLLPAVFSPSLAPRLSILTHGVPDSLLNHCRGAEKGVQMETDWGFEEVSPEQLREYIQNKREGDYLLIDVRQPVEYTGGHIPGANLIPLMELEAKLFELPGDRDMIFYCRSGSRSRAASTLVAESEVSGKRIYNLAGGIMAWDGKILPDFPKVEVFDKSKGLSELLFMSMDLEKGAWRFYTYILDRFGSQSFAKTIEHLVHAETAHAKAIYRLWKENEPQPQPFESLFTELGGEILEGGERLDDVLQRVETIRENVCLTLLEMALDIEYAAFDLYRTMAEQTGSTEAKSAFLSIAQAEKAHMQAIAEAMPGCFMN
jgi:rhodanese-related sulfurtransferase/rubrerythrin